MTLDIKALRRQFPILSSRVHGKPLCYLDNAATSQKPKAVLDRLQRYYKMGNANVHRGAHALSEAATHDYEAARQTVASFINAADWREIIWTSGTTEAINLVANTLAERFKPGDNIVLSSHEHHANIVPWQLLAERRGLNLHPVNITAQGAIDIDHYKQLLADHKPVLVSLQAASNALGVRHPIEQLIAMAKQHQALTLVDAAQLVAHEIVDVQQLGCDLLAFSGHKCFGPTATGVLWGRYQLLESLPPWQAGGEMITRVSFGASSFQAPPYRFEPGTPAIGEILGLAAAIEWLQAQPREALAKHEQSLLQQLRDGCMALPGVSVLAAEQANVGVVSLVIEGIHPQDMASWLDHQGVAARAGHHCAMPLMAALGLEGSLRLSIAPYNNQQDIDTALAALASGIETLGQDSPSDTSDKTLAIPPAPLAPLIEQLAGAKDWQQRMTLLMSYAELLPAPSQALMSSQHLLNGCQSDVWLMPLDSGIAGWSNARLMRGLLYLLVCARAQGAIELTPLLNQCGIEQLLSASRSAGVNAMAERLNHLKL